MELNLTLRLLSTECMAQFNWMRMWSLIQMAVSWCVVRTMPSEQEEPARDSSHWQRARIIT
jgi:hypothetical protein